MQRLTEDDFRRIEDFIERGDLSILDTNLPEVFNDINNRLQDAIVKKCRAYLAKNARLTERLEKIEEKREALYVEGEFGELGMDSALILQAVWYCLDECAHGEVKTTIQKAMNVMFEIYAVWLYKSKERLCVEHPVAQENGPWFWSALKKTTLTSPKPYKDSYLAICNQSPALAAMIKNASNKYCTHRESDIRSFICRCPAYKAVNKDHNNGKWNGLLDDGQIYLWRKDIVESKKQQSNQ